MLFVFMRKQDLLHSILKNKYNWNVSILIILVLVACSLMWILTMNFLRNLINYTDDTYSYYKSYYIAKAWLELALTEIDNTQVWFNHAIFDTTPINSNNFSCSWCYFQSQVLWRSATISNGFWQTTWCYDEIALSLLPSESITLPLFYDKSSSFYNIFIEENYTKNISDSLTGLVIIPIGTYYWSELNLWVVFENWGNTSWDYLFMKWMPMYPTDYLFSNYVNAFNAKYHDDSIWTDNWLPYLVISNPNDFEVRFCLWNKNWLSPEKIQDWPATKYFIISRGEYNWRTVWLQAIYAQPIPSFFISPYSY